MARPRTEDARVVNPRLPCASGEHELTAANRYERPDGVVICRACRRQRQREAHARKTGTSTYRHSTDRYGW